MRGFKPRPGTKSASHILQKPLQDIDAFTAIVRQLILQNPLGCTSYRTVRKTYPPVMVVRERYTAKFVYYDGRHRQAGSTSEVYDTAEGYRDGIHAVLSNMANSAAHRSRAEHVPAADRFSAIMKCHDPEGELFFLALARDRVTVSSYTDDAIRRKVETWTDRIPELR